ncbi:TetR/AcrR family transcriptional regulator [Paucilactobacillus hokkaidonensis]|uniref:TetR/AcrR family transcriptional regulator n=1 Tax=Paucilactobacillus hokkaidonensis TaxID=1193095 RepID=UPI000AF73F59
MNPTIFKNYRQWLLDQPMPKGKRSVLLAGLELFAQQGFNGTSTAQIADKAGVSQATIFKYFKTKQDLLLSILQPIIENFFPLYRDDFLDSLSQFKTLQELIHFIVRNRYQFLKDNADAVLIFTTEMLTNDTARELFTNIIKKITTNYLQ